MSERIVRSEGSNDTESLLSKICDQTFLKLWVYPNTYKKQADELCDVLVVFENHVFLFSVKDIKFNSDKEINVAWGRWKRKAIDESMEQLERAEAWIKKHPDKIFLDPKCTKKFPIEIKPENQTFHRIIVAHGAEDACKNFSEANVAGSLAISYGDDLRSVQKDTLQFPFMLSLGREKIFHVLDSYNLGIILGELDTIYDLIWYFEAKEEAIRQYDRLSYCGEEDLLAHYLLNFDPEKKEHFIGSRKEKFNFVHIGEGEWADFCRSDVYLRRKQADKPSYLWDEIIQRTLQNALDANLLGKNDLFNDQSALREMAKEPRFVRRELAKAMINSINIFPDEGGENTRNLSSYPSFYPDKRYVFLQLKPMPDKDYETEYRPFRQKMLEIACGVEKNKRPKSNKIIGLAIDSPKHSKGNSEDFILMDCSNWSKEDREIYEEANKVLKFFESENVLVKYERTYEFPDKKGPVKIKIGRNEQCPCGSGKKYKKCCINFKKE